MTAIDELTLRHGALIQHVWLSIGQARSVARTSPGQAECATQLRSMRHLRRNVLATHQAELSLERFPAEEIDNWFSPVERSLEKAEAYFTGVIRKHHPQHPAAQQYRQAKTQIRA